MTCENSKFGQHITELVARLALDPQAVAKAVISERAAEARMLAGQVRLKAPGVPVLGDLAAQLEARAARLDEVAANWGKKR